jgi:hypothetical protein
MEIPMRLGLIMATAVATLAIVTIGVQASPLVGGNGIASKIDNPVTKVLVAICESSPTESYCQSLGKGSDDDDDEDVPTTTSSIVKKLLDDDE